MCTTSEYIRTLCITTIHGLTLSRTTKLYNQATLILNDIQQGETYVITIIAVNDVGEGEPAMTTTSAG